MTTTLIFIRHAAHVHLNRQLSGRMPDIPLSEDGRAQAAALSRRLSGAGITRIWTSPLDRTVATAAAIADTCRLARPEPVAGLIEIDMGDWTGRAFDTFGDDPVWRRWNQERNTARIPGGETMAEAQARIVGVIDRAVRDHDGEVVGLVTHSDMIKAAVAHVLGMPLGQIARFDIDPASVTCVVAGDWGGRVMSLNEGVH